MQLFGTEPWTFFFVLAIVATQITLAYTLSNSPWWLLLLVAYLIGGTLNHSQQLLVHDISHNLCFKLEIPNKLLGIFANIATGVPSAITFTRYHMEHHQFQGWDGIDMDIPCDVELSLFTSSASKVLWLLLNPLFYGVRPLLVKPKSPTRWEAINNIVVLSFDVALVYFVNWQALAYLIASTLLGMGLHPVAGHFIAEHYAFVKGVETYSYYGPINLLNFNVGYHNEHHDFPKVPWSRLPQVKQIASEFYDNLPHHTSYLQVIYRYITDPTIGPHSRIKRRPLKEL